MYFPIYSSNVIETYDTILEMFEGPPLTSEEIYSFNIQMNVLIAYQKALVFGMKCGRRGVLSNRHVGFGF